MGLVAYVVAGDAQESKPGAPWPRLARRRRLEAGLTILAGLDCCGTGAWKDPAPHHSPGLQTYGSRDCVGSTISLFENGGQPHHIRVAQHAYNEALHSP